MEDSREQCVPEQGVRVKLLYQNLHRRLLYIILKKRNVRSGVNVGKWAHGDIEFVLTVT